MIERLIASPMTHSGRLLLTNGFRPRGGRIDTHARVSHPHENLIRTPVFGGGLVRLPTLQPLQAVVETMSVTRLQSCVGYQPRGRIEMNLRSLFALLANEQRVRWTIRYLDLSIRCRGGSFEVRAGR
jgi:hypothetical protein